MFWTAFLNVLAIIAIIVVAAFVMVFIGDLLISIIDGKKGIFFKGSKKAKVEEDEVDDNLSFAQLNELERLKKMYRNQTTDLPVTKDDDEYLSNSSVNYDLAKQEEQELQKKLSVVPAEPVAPLLTVKAEKPEADKETVYEQVDSVASDILSNYDSEPTNADRLNEYSQQLQNYSVDNTEDYEEGEEEPEVKEVVKEVVVDNPEIVERNKQLEEEVEQLRQALNDESSKEVLVDNPEIIEKNKKLEAELENLRQALKDAEQLNDQLQQEKETLEDAEVGNPLYTTVEECEARIELLENRLRVARKELKINDKEFKPLFKVRKNLNKYKERLRRKDLSVTRQKIALYGVNNYVDIDKDRAEKLANDIELLDGLRISVQDCENVVEQSKDRYPILEQNNRLLKTQISDLEHDLEVARGVLAALKDDVVIDEDENGIDDRDE